MQKTSNGADESKMLAAPRMTPHPRVALVTGGGSGIGMGVASALHASGVEVIIAGRSRSKLDEVAARHPGMHVEVLDVADPGAVAALAERVAQTHPALDFVLNNAGVQHMLDFTAAPLAVEEIAREIDINLKGLIWVTNAFLPQLARQPHARLVHVSSGLGFIPLAAAPVYSATKAAVHSFTVSLRRQLTGGPVKVIELIPPVVDTDLHRHLTRKPPNPIPLDKFVKAALAGIAADKQEIAVGLAKVTRTGARLAPGFVLKMVNQRRDAET